MLSQVNRGMLVELLVSQFLILHGWIVSRPLNVNGPFDLHIWKDSLSFTVECKLAYRSRRGTRYQIGLGPEQGRWSDYVGVYLPDTDEILFFRESHFDLSRRKYTGAGRKGGIRHTFPVKREHAVDDLTGPLSSTFFDS